MEGLFGHRLKRKNSNETKKEKKKRKKRGVGLGWVGLLRREGKREGERERETEHSVPVHTVTERMRAREQSRAENIFL